MPVSIIFARALVAELQARDFDSDEALRQVGIDPARLSDLRAVMTVEESDRLSCHAMELTQDPGLGLTIGMTAPESMLQVLGQLLVSHATLRSAFTTLQRYSALWDDGPAWTLSERETVASCSFEPAFRLGASTRAAVDFTLAMSMRIGRHFGPRDARIVGVHCQHPAPSYAQRYHDIFQCQVSFEQESNALSFPREYLDRPQFHADRTTRVELQRTAEELMAARAKVHSLSQRVHTFLRHERCLSDVEVTQVARHVGLSVRGLRRRLTMEGTTLSALVDEARCRVARERLSRPDVSIKATAELLGFSETSSFHRAFKRWTGNTAGRYRRTAESI